jgi:hypothetical protein
VQNNTGDCLTAAAAGVARQAERNMPIDIPILPDTQADVPSPNLIKYQISAGEVVQV